jgi:16S rRNA (cytidine1402-2'-O)-methyltransferase
VNAPERNPGFGRLYVIPSLLGMVAPATVLPQGTIEIARSLSHFVVETPRIARQFLKSLEMRRPLAELAMTELNEHTAAENVPALLEPTLRGLDLGLLTDAGCPGVADPGAPLVRAAHDAGVRVVPLAGPSAILLALMAAGMNGQQFAFRGYLPAKADARVAALRALDRAADSGATQIFIETPYRNDAMIAAVLSVCRTSLRFCVAVDLTLPDEQIVCRTVGEWQSARRSAIGKRPAIFLLGR